MNTRTVINFKTDKQIKDDAQKIAQEMGLSLSAVMNIYLKEFVRTEQLNIDLHNGHTCELSDAAKKDVSSAQKEYATGKMRSHSPQESLAAVEDMMK